ncbi:tumor necrosis factor receptor superfamily member 18 [Anabas testudineus]|uniref:TNFR-Cys domain-containing protein n=1 Tax=Anabas testudineus TaxID=64144 RepID=A0AAQ6IR62_ANATE|nr:tumor necrosis factor receptor superfamily member 18 [Anabas testudineus]
MIPLKLSLAAICLLTFWTIGSGTSCGRNQVYMEEKCCDMCRPGEYMEGFCSNDHNTICKPCKEGYYSSEFGMFDRCEACKSCQQEYAEKCTVTTDAKCACHSGFLCSNKDCSICEENKCATWEKLKRTDIPSGETTKYSYQCEPECPNNSTYFDVKDNICKPFTQCSAFGFTERFRGNKTHDAICGTHGKNGGDWLYVTLGIGFVLLSVTLLVLLCYACLKSLRKHKAKINHTAVETSEFHLSKEESGQQIIAQDESKDSFSHLGEVSIVLYP